MIQEPVQPTLSETPPARPTGGGRRSRGPIGLVIVACLVLAVPIAAAIAASSSSDPTSAVGASNAPGSSVEPRSDQGNGHGPKADKRPKGNGAPGKGPITIRAIIGLQLSLATEDGWSRTITATSSTVITKGGQTITVGDLNVGDEIRFSQARNADRTYTINAIVVPTPKAGGEVTAVDATSITVKRKGGITRVITVNGSTVYRLGSAAGTKADVKVGVRIDAQGTIGGDTFTAITVRIKLAEIGGEVTARTGDAITVKHRDGSTTVIHVTDKTTYKYKGKDAATLTDIAVGDRVSADGILRADGSLDAISVEGRGPKTQNPRNPVSSSAAPG